MRHTSPIGPANGPSDEVLAGGIVCVLRQIEVAAAEMTAAQFCGRWILANSFVLDGSILGY